MATTAFVFFCSFESRVPSIDSALSYFCLLLCCPSEKDTERLLQEGGRGREGWTKESQHFSFPRGFPTLKAHTTRAPTRLYSFYFFPFFVFFCSHFLFLRSYFCSYFSFQTVWGQRGEFSHAVRWTEMCGVCFAGGAGALQGKWLQCHRERAPRHYASSYSSSSSAAVSTATASGSSWAGVSSGSARTWSCGVDGASMARTSWAFSRRSLSRFLPLSWLSVFVLASIHAQ